MKIDFEAQPEDVEGDRIRAEILKNVFKSSFTNKLTSNKEDPIDCVIRDIKKKLKT